MAAADPRERRRRPAWSRIPERAISPTSIEFRDAVSYAFWAATIDSEMPGLRQRLVVTRAPSGAAVVWLCLSGGRRLADDGYDALVYAARRAQGAAARR
jgi:hypothetical protein